MSYDYSLYSDANLDQSGNPSADANERKMALRSIQRVGRDNSTLPATSLSYYPPDRDSDYYYINGGWNRLYQVNNGPGGLLPLYYENIGKITRASFPRPTQTW